MNSIRAVLEKLLIMTGGISGRAEANKEFSIDNALAQIADVVEKEKKYLKGSDSPQDKYLEQMSGWNACCDHIAEIIRGGK